MSGEACVARRYAPVNVIYGPRLRGHLHHFSSRRTPARAQGALSPCLCAEKDVRFNFDFDRNVPNYKALRGRYAPIVCGVRLSDRWRPQPAPQRPRQVAVGLWPVSVGAGCWVSPTHVMWSRPPAHVRVSSPHAQAFARWLSIPGYRQRCSSLCTTHDRHARRAGPARRRSPSMLRPKK